MNRTIILSKSGSTVKVLNTLGQVLQSNEIHNSQNMDFELSNIAAGIYYVQVDYQGATQSMKMIVR